MRWLPLPRTVTDLLGVPSTLLSTSLVISHVRACEDDDDDAVSQLRMGACAHLPSATLRKQTPNPADSRRPLSSSPPPTCVPLLFNTCGEKERRGHHGDTRPHLHTVGWAIQTIRGTCPKTTMDIRVRKPQHRGFGPVLNPVWRVTSQTCRGRPGPIVGSILYESALLRNPNVLVCLFC